MRSREPSLSVGGGDQCRSAPWQLLGWIARLDWGLLKIIVPAALVLLVAFAVASCCH